MGRNDGKTEKATPRRRREARREGTVAKSQEVGTAAALLAALLALRVFAPRAAAVFTGETRALLSSAGSPLDPGRLADSATRLALEGLGPFLFAAVVAATVAGVGQVGFQISPKAAMPKLSNLDPRKGLEKLRPAAAGWELTRSLAKLGLLVAVLWSPVRTWMREFARERSLESGLADLQSEMWVVLLRSVALMVAIAAADYAWNRYRTNQRMKMSKDDVKREHKDSEGDPMVRSQRRRRQMELSRNRMLHDVAGADVVVTNPTHFAVALRYTDGDGAPRVVAKGVDRMALRIRREAYRNGVPVTEDRPLARALYRRCKIGQHVPAALYEAVAVVLAVAYRRRGRMAAGSTP